MNALYLIGFVQSLFFIVLILSKKKIQLKDYILSLYILILGLNLIFIYWQETGFHDKNPIVITLDIAYWTLLGPLLFLYIDITTSETPRLKWKHLIHLFPLVFVFISFSGYFFTGMNDSFFNYRSNSLLFIPGYFVWMYNSPIYYIILIFKLRSHKKKIKHYYSSSKYVDLKWLNYLVHGFAVFLFFLLTRGYIVKLFNLDITIDSYHYTWLVMVIYIFGIGYFGNKQRGVFIEPDFEKRNIKLRNQYSKTGLSDDEALLIQNKLNELMSNEKPYLDFDLTLPKLAEMLGTTSHKLSQVINEKYNSNFFEYVNRYRIDTVKSLLKDPLKTDIKIMALAYDCGFNSKSAFYSFFKKQTSITPSEYREKQLTLADV